MRKRYIVSWMCFLGLCGCDLVYDYDLSQMYTVRKEACEMSVERATAAINVGVPGDRKVRYNGYFEYKLGRCSCRNELCQLGEVCNDYVSKDAASCVDYVCSDGVVACSSTETGEGYLYRCEDNNWMQPARCSIGCAEDGKSCIDNQVDECDEGEHYCSEIDGKTALWTCEDGEYVSKVCHHGCDQANGCVRKNECKDDAQACVGEWIMECAQGGWLEPHQCAGGKCENDSCVFEEMDVCTVGGYRCNGVKLEQCNSSSGWETVNGGSVCYEKKSLSCVNKRLNEELCEYGCSNGKCMCKDEDRRCVNNHSEVCKNGKWDKESDCEYGCKNGKCNDCKDGTFKCDSQKKLWKCENGTWSGENFNDIEKHCKCPSENSGNENIVYESIYNICNNICVNNGNK